VGRLLLIDSRAMRFETIRYAHDPDTPFVPGTIAVITGGYAAAMTRSRLVIGRDELGFDGGAGGRMGFIDPFVQTAIHLGESRDVGKIDSSRERILLCRRRSREDGVDQPGSSRVAPWTEPPFVRSATWPPCKPCRRERRPCSWRAPGPDPLDLGHLTLLGMN